ncbi:MAG: zinc ribbon domain-containing protein [Promethearchaeota archaeon]
MWQVHWFFAQVQDHLTEMAMRVGIYVEWVDPRHTSTRCSRCGERGTRYKKQFTCAHCGFQANDDLNAARNISTAPISPCATRMRGRGPFPLPGKRDKRDRDVQVGLALKERYTRKPSGDWITRVSFALLSGRGKITTVMSGSLCSHGSGTLLSN